MLAMLASGRELGQGNAGTMMPWIMLAIMGVMVLVMMLIIGNTCSLWLQAFMARADVNF